MNVTLGRGRNYVEFTYYTTSRQSYYRLVIKGVISGVSFSVAFVSGFGTGSTRLLSVSSPDPNRTVLCDECRSALV